MQKSKRRKGKIGVRKKEPAWLEHKNYSGRACEDHKMMAPEVLAQM